MLEKLVRYLNRRKSPVIFNDLARSKPVSSWLGVDRGTPVDRHYIEQFLREHSGSIKGRVLEVGDDGYSKRFAADRAGTTFEVLHAVAGNQKATIVGSLTEPETLPAEAFDCFICTQTFGFIFDVQKAVLGAHRLLKPGGVLLATVSGISQISRYDMERWGDYWRFTTASLERLFRPVFPQVQIESFGNALAACAFLQGIVVEDLPDRTLLDDRDPDYQVLLTVVARKEG